MEWNDVQIREMFRDAADFNVRQLDCNGYTLFAYSIDGLTASSNISEYIIKPVMETLTGQSMEDLYIRAFHGAVFNAVARECKNLEDAAFFLVNGFCVLLFPGVGAIAFEAKTPEKRSISTPDLENTAKGPKDAFVETNRSNTSLVRRHLRSPGLRIYETKVGKRSLTNVSVLWIDGLTNPEYVKRMKKRLDSIHIDGMLTTASVEEYITGSRATAFPMLQYTERTDRFCQGLLDGRIGLFVDGIPLGYLAPVDIGYLMDSPEDYSRDYVSASWVRILRYIALLFDLLMPGVYVAMTMYHWNWLSGPLAQVIEQGRQSVPFSPAWEILMLLIAFELLQESGIHLPQNIGQSVSIIGGIVVGTVGVEAGLISSIALITVSVAGICGFVLPNRDLAAAIRVWRFIIAILAALFGLWGVAAGVAVLVVRLMFLKSLGVRYMIALEGGLVRRRLRNSKHRDRKLAPENDQNQQ